MFVESTLTHLSRLYPDTAWTVLCNREGARALQEAGCPGERRVISALENQYTKALWLEFAARRLVDAIGLDRFWIPSGANSFPGRWRTPTVVTFLDLGEFHVPGKYGTARTLYRKRLCIPRSVRRAAAITAISQSTARDLKAIFPSAPEIRVIYPGLSPRPATGGAVDARAVVLRETGLELDRILLTPGRTDYRGKGLDILLDAHEQLRGRERKLPLHILVGPPGEGHEQLLAEIKKRGLADRVRYLGRVSDECLDALYRLSEMLVAPSRYEGFGFTVLEAMQRSVPVIYTEAGSLPEVAGEAGLRIPGETPAALAAAMQRLLGDEELRRDLVDQGARQAGKFTWEESARAMREAFESVK